MFNGHIYTNNHQSCEKIRVSLEGCEVEKDISFFIKDRGTGQEIPDPPKYINFCRGDLNDASSETSEEEHYSVAQFQRTINPAYRSSSPQPSTYESHHDPQSDLAQKMTHNAPAAQSSRENTVTPQKQAQPPGHHGDIPTIPHNEYPTDGMTMFCRTGPPSERSSATSANRPSSRDSQSDCSNPTSFSSMEPPPKQPAKPMNEVAPPEMTPEKPTQKKRSAFFSNSPFRRKSKHEKERQSTQESTPPSAHRNTWAAAPRQVKSIAPGAQKQPVFGTGHQSGSPEPADPRANFQLNVGNNVFDVASPDTSKKNGRSANNGGGDLDPIAQALADLKGVGKQASLRVSADRYHGITSPAPPSNVGTDSNAAAAQRGTPPPAYNDPSVKRLDAPAPAFTSAQMQKTSRKYVGQTQDMFNNNTRSSQRVRGGEQPLPRATSPAPRRSASPQPMTQGSASSRHSQRGNPGQPSPVSYQSSSMNSRYRQSPSGTPTKVGGEPSYSPQYSRHASPNEPRGSASPQPQFRQHERPRSGNGSINGSVNGSGMELQLSSNQMNPHNGPQMDGYNVNPRGRSQTADMRRPMSTYYGSGDGGSGGQANRTRSRSVVVADGGRQLSRDGRPVLHFGKFPSPP